MVSKVVSVLISGIALISSTFIRAYPVTQMQNALLYMTVSADTGPKKISIDSLHFQNHVFSLY